MRCERNSPLKENKKVKNFWRMKTYCINCEIISHERATCWTLHPEQHLKDKASVQEPVETIVRQEKVPQRDDPFTLISERWFLYFSRVSGLTL